MDTNNIYYVYAHLHDDGEPYYIGKGKGRRAYRLEDNSHVRLLAEGLTERQAFTYERILIQHYGRTDIGTGILRNETNGGEGASGIVWTQEQRDSQGKLAAGRILTSDWKSKIRASVIALEQSAKYASASCIHCGKVITCMPGAVEANINQHIYYKHKDKPSSWIAKSQDFLAPVSCIVCRQVMRGVDHRFDRHFNKHKTT